MPNNLQKLLARESLATDLTLRLRGIEKEGLRVSFSGSIAQDSHPSQLGNPLTHPQVTTDFAESQLELVTQQFDSISGCLDSLHNLHVWVTANLKSQYLWPASMPCDLQGANINLAKYGSSHLAKLKEIYRSGLAHRYGSKTQLISGVHYNLSFGEQFWPAYKQHLLALHIPGRTMSGQSIKDFRTSSYLHLVRNFYRYSPLLVYLFGASPTYGTGFIDSGAASVQDNKNYPYATCLRMSKIGYINNYNSWSNANSLSSYLQHLLELTASECAQYADIGLYNQDGSYRQINCNILQMENEDYSIIRPKRSGAWDIRPIERLNKEGIEYLEIRTLDINPFMPLGIDKTQAQFIECFMVYCLLLNSDPIYTHEQRQLQDNYNSVAIDGRNPQLSIVHNGSKQLFTQYALEMLEGVMQVAKILGDEYLVSCQLQQQKIADVALTPSAQIINAMVDKKVSYQELMLANTQQYHKFFTHSAVNVQQQQYLNMLAQQSHHTALDFKDTVDFNVFLDNYIGSYTAL